jgi:hypothetical protein
LPGRRSVQQTQIHRHAEELNKIKKNRGAQMKRVAEIIAAGS